MSQPGGWFDAVSRLVRDADLRHVIQERGREYARYHYDLQLVQQVWCRQLQALLGNGAGHSASLTARGDPQSGGVPVTQVADATGRIPGATHAWACWSGRVCKVIRTLAQRVFPRSLDRIRPSLHNLSMLLRIRVTLRFWSILHRMLPRQSIRESQGPIILCPPSFRIPAPQRPFTAASNSNLDKAMQFKWVASRSGISGAASKNSVSTTSGLSLSSEALPWL